MGLEHSSLQTRCFQLLLNNQVEKLSSLLLHHFAGDTRLIRKKIMLLTYQWKRCVTDRHEGLIDYYVILKEERRIVSAFLDLLQKVEH